MLYRLIAQRMPFRAEGGGELMAMHIYQEPPSMREVAPWVPESVASFVHTLLRKDKSERPSMQEVVVTLDKLGVEFADLRAPELPADADLSDDDDFDADEDAESSDTASLLATLTASSISLDTPSALRPRSPSGAYRTVPSNVSGRFGGLLLGAPLITGSHEVTPHRTTGSHSSGEKGRSPVGNRRLGFVISASIGGAVVGSLLLAMFLWGIRHPTLPAPATSPQLAAKAPLAARVRWSIRTTPPGASVIRVSDGALLGRTPWVREGGAALGVEELRLVAPGYADRMLELDRGQPVEIVQALEAAPETAAGPASGAAGAAKKTTHKHRFTVAPISEGAGSPGHDPGSDPAQSSRVDLGVGAASPAGAASQPSQ